MFSNLKIKILDKFIFTQVLAAVLVCVFLFAIIWIAPETLVRIIKKYFLDHITIQHAFKLLMYELPKVLLNILPIGIFLGTVFTFDKFSKNNELAILRGIGLSYNRIMASVMVIGVVFSLACFYVADRLVPWASMASGEGRWFKQQFVYIKKDENKIPIQGVIISHHTLNQIKDLTVVNFKENEKTGLFGFESILTAPYALKKDNHWVLPSGKEYTISESGVYNSIKDVENYVILQDAGDDVYALMKGATRRDRSFTSAEMWEYIKLLDKQDYVDEKNYFLAKFYQRFLHPITCLIFAIIGCLLGCSPPRSQRLVGFTIVASILFAYYITMPFFNLLAEKGVMPPFVTASIPFVAFIIGIFIIKKVKDL